MRVIKHFSANLEKSTLPLTESHSIRVLLDVLASTDGEAMFADTKAGTVSRKDDVEDTVMYIIGMGNAAELFRTIAQWLSKGYVVIQSADQGRRSA